MRRVLTCAAVAVLACAASGCATSHLITLGGTTGEPPSRLRSGELRIQGYVTSDGDYHRFPSVVAERGDSLVFSPRDVEMLPGADRTIRVIARSEVTTFETRNLVPIMASSIAFLALGLAVTTAAVIAVAIASMD